MFDIINGIMQLSMLVTMGEITSLTKNTKAFYSLKTTVPISIVRDWKLKPGDKLDWTRKIIDNEIGIVVKKVETSSTTTTTTRVDNKKRKSNKRK
jgi:hypothetical protein